MRSEVLFGDPRIIDSLRLPAAYRSLPRPLSALKPSHPSDSVVYQLPGPTVGVGTYARLHRPIGLSSLVTVPFTVNISLDGCIH